MQRIDSAADIASRSSVMPPLIEPKRLLICTIFGFSLHFAANHYHQLAEDILGDSCRFCVMSRLTRVEAIAFSRKTQLNLIESLVNHQAQATKSA